MLRASIIVLCFAAEAYAQQRPQVSASPIQVVTTPVEVRGVGFTPLKKVTTHLRRPDGSEYGVLRFVADNRGVFSHTIDTLLLAEGIHELWAEDETSKAISNTVRFAVGFETSTPALSEAQQVVLPYFGIWRGSGARNIPSVASTVLISITGRRGGSAGGTISYPDLSCGGVLTFRAIYRDSLELMETSMYGAERCPGNGIVTVKLAVDGNLTFQWRHPTIAGTATGKLAPVR